MNNDMLRLPSRAFLAQAIDRSSRDAGSSGGLFGLLARTVLTHGGVVVGAAFDDDGIVRHRMAHSRQDLTPLLKSKYVWSDFTRVLPEVRKALSDGNEVLFAGTPCQVSAVRNVCTRNSTGRLVCIDVLCHGTPAPEVFASYRAMRERQHGASLAHYDWRDKTKGWSPLRTRLRFSDGAECLEEMNDYFFAFQYNLSLREGCGRCPWARPERGGDLTLGDAWGLMRDWFNKADNTGTSLVLVNTPKGAELLKSIKGSIRLRPTSLKLACRKQDVLRHPPVRPTAAQTFTRIFAESKDFGCAFSAARAELLEEATARFKKIQKEYNMLSGEAQPFLTRFLRRLAYHRRLKQLRRRLKELDGLLKVSVEETKRT